jgi:hypothetical protein
LRAHHLGRVFTAQGYEVRLMAPEYVAPYVKAQKNDDRDAEAIAEAATRPTMRFVALKSEAQLDQQTLHRARSRLVNSRTRLTNQLRAILLERGITVAKGRRALAALDREFVETARTVAPARRLATIPGIGALNATALNAAVGEAEDFASARDLAAWLGLVPRQTTTGGRARLGGITKRGNVYLRTLLIHGACAALPGLSRGETPLGAWLRGLLAQPGTRTWSWWRWRRSSRGSPGRCCAAAPTMPARRPSAVAGPPPRRHRHHIQPLQPQAGLGQGRSKARGPRLAFHPCPDFNLIEMAKLKALLRKVAERTVDVFTAKVHQLLRHLRL